VRGRRIIVSALVLLYAGATAWWVFYFPEDRALLYRAVPPDAVFVTEHERLGQRWSSVCTNTFVVWLWEISGSTRDEALAAASDPGLAKLLRWLAHRRTVACYAPRFGPAGWPAWIIASDSGWRGQAARAVFASGLVRNFRRNTVGIRTWYTSPASSSGWRTSATLVQGIAVVCFSRDPSAARYAAERMEQWSPGFAPLEMSIRQEGRASFPDRGWFDRGLIFPDCAGISHAFDLDVESPDWTRIRVKSALSCSDNLRALREMDAAASIGGLFSRDPELLLLVPGRVADLIASNAPSSSRWASVARIADAARDHDWPVIAAMFGGELSGRILGLRVPTVALGLHLQNPEAGHDLVSAAFDELNSKHAMGLVASRPDSGRPNLTLIGMSSNPLMGALRNEDMPALVNRGPWLLFFSNAGAADKVMPRLPGSGRGCGWLDAMNERDGAVGFAWVNFENANKAMRDALAVLSLALKLQAGDGGERLRSNLDNARAWIKAAVSLGECGAWLVPSDAPGGYDLEIRIGRGAARGDRLTMNRRG